MTIRSRLLMLLLPTLCAFILLISLFFYFNWSREILDSFRWRLQSVVIATAQTVDADEIEWIQSHLHEPGLAQDKQYLEYKEKLFQLKKKLPITHLYIVKIEPTEKENGFKQVFLIDVSGDSINEGNLPGEIDYSETEEQHVYLTKKAFVTPIYEARKTHQRYMSAYAPIMNSQGHVIALLAADVSMEEIDLKLNRALLMIMSGALITLAMIIITVFLIADRISKPVQKLNNAALDIAAGEYETHIEVDGPKEIVELANTLNTMSECLEDNLHRLKESSLIRERLYGEHECAQLLQHYLLQKKAEEFQLPDWKLLVATTNYTKSSPALALRYSASEKDQLEITLLESQKTGFSSLVDICQASALPLSNLTNYAYVNCFFTEDGYLCYNSLAMSPPLIWSIKEEQWSDGAEKRVALHPQDMVFLMNSTLSNYFGSHDAITTWFGRVLRHFAKDGIAHIHTILMNEINFLARREGIKENLTIVMVQGTNK